MKIQSRVEVSILVMSILFCYLASCSKWTDSENSQIQADSKSISLLKANLPSHFLSVKPSELMSSSLTKLQIHDPVEIDSDKLAWDLSKSYKDKDHYYLQIPISNHGLINATQLKFTKIEVDSIFSRAGLAKTFLILRHNHDYEDPFIFLITMIPQPKYFSEEKIAKMDFFNRKDMNGIVMFSDLSGDLFEIILLVNGGYAGSYEVLNGSHEAEDIAIYLRVHEKTAQTKCANGDDYEWDLGELDECVCIADRDPPRTIFFPGAGGDRENNMDEYIDHIDSPHIGGGVNPNLGKFEVTLTPDGPGTTPGSGYYDAFKNADFTASPNSVGNNSVADFISWSGGINSSSATVTVYITHKINAKAKFVHKTPCSDTINGKANPLVKMSLPEGWNYRGKRYGANVRTSTKGDSLDHWGIDLYAGEGTPVFSMFDGTVVGIRNSFNNNNKVSGSLGNYITIESTVGGNTIQTKYCHLHCSNKLSLSVGNSVSSGQLIGYTGRTGNLEEVTVSHLHLELSKNGIRRCPEDYLNAEIIDDKKITTPCD